MSVTGRMIGQFATTVQDLLKLRHNARSQTPLKQDWYLETEKASYENKIHVIPARRNVLYAGQSDRQTNQPAHQRRNRGQEPVKATSPTMFATAKAATITGFASAAHGRTRTATASTSSLKPSRWTDPSLSASLPK